MAEVDHCCSTQLIDGHGEFNVVGLENFMQTTKLSQCGLSYAVVAIMGPQSSGALLFNSFRALIFLFISSFSFSDSRCSSCFSYLQFFLD